LAVLSAYIKKDGPNVKLLFPLLMLEMPATRVSNELLSNLFFTFLKIGAILYGSGYVLFAYIDSEMVTTDMITRQQLTDAIAIGQFTPGPVFSSVTFIGYQAGGVAGAIVSTIAIFLPSFLFVALLNPLVAYLRRSPLFSAFIDAVNVASVSIIAAVCFQLGRNAIADWRTATIALISLIVLWFFKRLNSAWIIGGGAVAGYLLLLI
jgi:chromate transporter